MMTDRQADRRIDRRMDGWTDERMDVRMAEDQLWTKHNNNKQIICPYIYILPHILLFQREVMFEGFYICEVNEVALLRLLIQ